jgi:hypothetical protein
MTYEERKSRFMAAVRAEAMKQSEQINRATEDYVDGELAKAEEEVRYETEAEVRSKMTKLRREIGLSISTAQRGADSELYACRAEIEEKVFDDVKTRLGGFRATADYDLYMTDGAEHLNELFDAEDEIEFYYASYDESKLEALTKLIRARVTAKASDKIKLGGFRAECIKKKLAVDYTLDTALEHQRENFRTIPELRLDIVSG